VRGHVTEELDMSPESSAEKQKTSVQSCGDVPRWVLGFLSGIAKRQRVLCLRAPTATMLSRRNESSIEKQMTAKLRWEVGLVLDDMLVARHLRAEDFLRTQLR